MRTANPTPRVYFGFFIDLETKKELDDLVRKQGRTRTWYGNLGLKLAIEQSKSELSQPKKD